MWRYNYIYPNELCHYGVKGMKWGVRRSKEALRFNRSSIISSVNHARIRVNVGGHILTARITDHGADRAVERNVDARSIKNALQKPLAVSSLLIDTKGRKSIRFTGERATVNINPEHGGITTVWLTSSGTVNKIRKKGVKA